MQDEMLIERAIRGELELHSILPGKPVVVGISGGMDSICLFVNLVQTGFQVVPVHFDHQIRPESTDDALFVQDFTSKMGFELVLGEGNVPLFAQEHKLSIEEAARERRYRFLFEVCAKKDAQCVMVAHTADDQVETVVMNVIRGSGLNGLAGMSTYQLPNPWSSEYPVVRPMLNIWRTDIEQFINNQDIPFIQDKSNIDRSYYRNRIRHDLIPVLQEYNPGVKANIWKLAETVSIDLEFIEEKIREVYQTIVSENDKSLLIDIKPFLKLDLSMQRRILMSVFEKMVPSQQPYEFEQIERVRKTIAAKKNGSQVDVGGGIIGGIENDVIRFNQQNVKIEYPEYPQIESTMHLEIPFEINLNRDWFLSSQEISDAHFEEEDVNTLSDHFTAYLEVPEGSKIKLRPRESGDQIRPLGMQGQSVKISDVMIDRKIPQKAREEWPLLIIDEEIAWIPGIKVAHTHRIKNRQNRIVKFRCFRLGS